MAVLLRLAQALTTFGAGSTYTPRESKGLKVPQKQPKRGRLWLNDGSCIGLRPEYPLALFQAA